MKLGTGARTLVFEDRQTLKYSCPEESWFARSPPGKRFRLNLPSLDVMDRSMLYRLSKHSTQGILLYRVEQRTPILLYMHPRIFSNHFMYSTKYKHPE